MIVTPFMREDLEAMDVQPFQEAAARNLEEHTLDLMENTESYTILYEGEPMACVGILPVWGNRAWVWSFLSRHAGPHMKAITRICDEIMRASSFNWIEACALAGHEAGGRWLKMLGFECVKQGARNLLGDGETYDLYLRNQE